MNAKKVVSDTNNKEKGLQLSLRIPYKNEGLYAQ